MAKQLKEIENKETLTKDKQNKKKKIKRYIFIVLISLIVIGLVAVILSYILLYDNNKNTHKDNQNDNVEIIKKNFINGFKSTSQDGVFSFTLPIDDVNQMLMNAYKEIDDKTIESIYYESKGSYQYFYVDLPQCCMVPSRVVIETIVSNINEYKVELKINKVSKGKINIIDKAISKGYLTSKYVSNISKHSLLPISYNDQTQTFLVDVLSLMNYFPSGDIKDSIFNYVYLYKEKFISYGSSLFSFNVNFRNLQSSNHLNSRELESKEDIEYSLEMKALNFDESTIFVGQETSIYDVSETSFSNIISHEIDVSKKETYASSLTSNVAIFYIKYIHSVFAENKIKYILNVSLAGYEIDISINSEVVETYPLYKTYLTLSKNVKIGDFEVDSSSDLMFYYQSYMDRLFENLAKKYSYFIYSNESKIFGFDFSNIETLVVRPELEYKYLSFKAGKMGFYIGRLF